MQIFLQLRFLNTTAEGEGNKECKIFSTPILCFKDTKEYPPHPIPSGTGAIRNYA